MDSDLGEDLDGEPMAEDFDGIPIDDDIDGEPLTYIEAVYSDSQLKADSKMLFKNTLWGQVEFYIEIFLKLSLKLFLGGYRSRTSFFNKLVLKFFCFINKLKKFLIDLMLIKYIQV